MSTDDANGAARHEGLPFLQVALKLLRILDPNNLKQPQTFFDDFARELGAELSKGPSEVAAFVAQCLGPAFIEIIKNQERELERKATNDPELGAFVRLMESAHRAVPMAPVQIVTHMNDLT
jgi:hypothetical protein